MNYKVFIITIVTAISTINCSITKNFVYHSNINQGNYLSASNIAKIKKGMNQQQITYLLGTPTLKSLFGQQIWYYIFRQQFNYKNIKQQTLTLTFNEKKLLTNIKINNNLIVN